MKRKGAKKTRPPTPQPPMRITTQRREQIERLAEALAEIAPSTSPGSGFCVRKVAHDIGLQDYWKKQKNKKADIAHLPENVVRRHPRKPKPLVLAIVRGGVDWKARKGERVTQAHLNAIAKPMEALGFRIRKELQAIEIPEPTRVRHPSQDVAALLDRLQLHPSLADDERFEKFIQDALQDHNTFGRDLMAKAFNEKNPQIALNAMQSANDRTEQEGFKFLTMGAMSGMSNLYSHGDVTQMSAMDAIERLAFVSLLFKRVDKALSNRQGALP